MTMTGDRMLPVIDIVITMSVAHHDVRELFAHRALYEMSRKPTSLE
jgi:hypothetical protein